MKVKDVIKSMQYYNPEDEIVILWWDKDIISCEDDLSDNDWAKIVKILDDENHLDFAQQVISDEIYNALINGKVDA